MTQFRLEINEIFSPMDVPIFVPRPPLAFFRPFNRADTVNSISGSSTIDFCS